MFSFGETSSPSIPTFHPLNNIYNSSKDNTHAWTTFVAYTFDPIPRIHKHIVTDLAEYIPVQSFWYRVWTLLPVNSSNLF